MTEDIYDPLEDYLKVYRDRFKTIAETTFDELTKEAQIDIDANRKTCSDLYATEDHSSSIKKHIKLWTAWSVILWLAVIGGTIAAVISRQELAIPILVIIGMAIVGIIVYLIMRVHRRLKVMKRERDELDKTIVRLKDEATAQMSALNSLYDWDILTRMMSKAVPRLEFDPYFTTQRLADLKVVYNWDNSFNKERSVIYSHSGLINGNPFVFCRTRKMKMGTKTYEGSKTISWTTRERDSDGKYRTVSHSEELTATVTAPYPEYFEKTRLIYGNTAAPDLIFYRKQSGLAEKKGSLSFKWKQHSLRKKARNLTNADFAMMTNEEFEVAFDTSDRNNNQQFALLFTPLAQENMLKLLRDKEVGYGDDFDFDKHEMINTITPNHIQELNLDMNPTQYHHFDYDKAKANFYALNANYFRAIYFSIAPLLCVPMYQQIRSREDIYGHEMPRHSAFWEHEALANFWGQEKFMDPSCVTDCILKTSQSSGKGDNSIITVHAYGYRSEDRLKYVSTLGGDGRWHDVPVHWDEYLPVKGIGNIYISEDNQFKDDETTHGDRLKHINSVLGEGNLSLYRRHIASKLFN